MDLIRFPGMMTGLRNLPLTAALLLGGCFGYGEWGDGPQTTIRPETDTGRVIQEIYALVTWIGIGIFIVVAGLMIYALVRYRARPGQESELPKQVHGSAVLESVWTIVPAIILIFISVPTWSGIFRAAKPPLADALIVKAIGHQWWWEFQYPAQGVVTANEMHLPAGRPVVVETFSVDVIHAFWVPKLAGKIDSLPGHTNRLWFTPEKTGLYYGQCAEYCGTSHANMRFRVHVDTEADFQAWVARQKLPPAAESDDAKAGEQLFVTKGCIACHTLSGVPVAVGVLGPNLTNLKDRTSLAAGIIDNTPEDLVLWLRQTQTVKPGALMGRIDPVTGKYVPIPMTDQEAGQLAAYLRSAPAAAPAPQPVAAVAPSAPAEPKSAQQLFMEKACFGCHVIPGIPAAVGTVGPSLAGLMSRDKIAAGLLANTPDNLRKWLSNPRAVKADTVMVTPPLSEAEIETLIEFLTKLK